MSGRQCVAEHHRREEILARTTLFDRISRQSREALAAICLPATFNKRQVLFLQGDKGEYIYVLIAGGVQLSKSAPDGREIVIKVVKAGEMFAEAILFERDRYPVSAVALKTSHLYKIPKLQFSCLLQDEAFRNDFLGNLFEKMRFLADQIEYLTSHDVEDRLFLFLEEQFGRKTRIVPNMSKKDVAAAIGATPETFSRLLLRLKNAGRLSWEGRTIVVSADAWKKQKTGEAAGEIRRG
ncbi:MAG: cyclic nucleotide-binding domain-containing protein [Chitinivibrionales bacterium]|nr:cyclic nucleotide-binding domain-containing protein [Chitinivibrionales bacterium]MBD3396483.1 cyclic nucleotide-binding domain-containing protein [Chitinivibrionales bacterium]